jgi:hypothetical protein
MDKYPMRRLLLHSGQFLPGRETKARADRSTGCHRGTRGEVVQVQAGVAVPIMDHAAAVADPRAVGRRAGGCSPSTGAPDVGDHRGEARSAARQLSRTVMARLDPS